MNQTFIYAMAGILLLPLVPAFILYKFLPSRTSVSGPFRGLDLKLTGAFSGYFLLVLVAVGVFFPILKSQQQARIDDLEEQLKADAQPASQVWKIIGHVVSTIPEQTKVFFDDDMPAFPPTGDFELDKKCALDNGKPIVPKWICVYNKTDGYKVINLNRMLNSPDIVAFNISFDDTAHIIRIGKPIDIQSRKNDSLKYVGTFVLQNPEIAQTLSQSRPGLLHPDMINAAVRADTSLRARALQISPSIRDRVSKKQ